MNHIAVISDIHGNLEALTAVLEDILQKDIDRIYCLGDVIGYGPNPLECLDLVFKYCEVALMGNHEGIILDRNFSYLNPIFDGVISWTRSQLKPGWLSSLKKRNRWQRLRLLPVCYTEDNYLFVHGSPRDPTMEYILKSDTEGLFGKIPEKIQQIFAQIDQICFVGHTCIPGIITEDSKWYDLRDFGGVWKCKKKQKIICNVGSVGMMSRARMGDRRPCYVIASDDEICYRRVAYDYSKTCAKIEKHPLIPIEIADVISGPESERNKRCL